MKVNEVALVTAYETVRLSFTETEVKLRAFLDRKSEEQVRADLLYYCYNDAKRYLDRLAKERRVKTEGLPCAFCKRNDLLVSHHWWDRKGVYCSKMICQSCNSILTDYRMERTFGGFPDERLQALYIRYFNYRRKLLSKIWTPLVMFSIPINTELAKELLEDNARDMFYKGLKKLKYPKRKIGELP